MRERSGPRKKESQHNTVLLKRALFSSRHVVLALYIKKREIKLRHCTSETYNEIATCGVIDWVAWRYITYNTNERNTCYGRAAPDLTLTLTDSIIIALKQTVTIFFVYAYMEFYSDFNLLLCPTFTFLLKNLSRPSQCYCVLLDSYLSSLACHRSGSLLRSATV